MYIGGGAPKLNFRYTSLKQLSLFGDCGWSTFVEKNQAELYRIEPLQRRLLVRRAIELKDTLTRRTKRSGILCFASARRPFQHSKFNPMPVIGILTLPLLYCGNGPKRFQGGTQC